MYIKQSLIQAEKEAKELSLKSHDTIYYVMDKRNKRAVCHCLPIGVQDKLLKGYFITCRYINGERRM